MIGDRQMWRQYDLNIHRDLILMSRGVFKVDHLVDNLISGLNLIVECINLFGKIVKIFFQGIVFVLAEQTIHAGKMIFRVMPQVVVFCHNRIQIFHMLLLIIILLVDQLKLDAAAVFAGHLPYHII